MLLFLPFFNLLKISMLTFFGATFSDCHTLFGATFARNMVKFFGCGFIYSGTSAFAENGARFCTSTSLSEQFRMTCSVFLPKNYQLPIIIFAPYIPLAISSSKMQ